MTPQKRVGTVRVTVWLTQEVFDALKEAERREEQLFGARSRVVEQALRAYLGLPMKEGEER